MDNTTINTINNVLNEWAEKFGTTVEKLVPEMQKYYIVQYVVTVLAWVIVFVAMLVLGKYLIKKHYKIEEESCDYDELHVWGYITCGFSLVPFIFICYFTTVLFQWIVSPSASLIDKIISVIGGK